MASKKGKTKARSHTASKSNRKRRNPAASKAEKAGANETLLPAVGTVIQKLDRNGKVRCECAVAKNGISLCREPLQVTLGSGRRRGQRPGALG